MINFMAQSTALRNLSIARAHFDPSNAEHVASLEHYLATGSWLQQFFPEGPYIDVPMTVLRKFSAHMISMKGKQKANSPVKKSVRNKKSVRKKAALAEVITLA